MPSTRDGELPRKGYLGMGLAAPQPTSAETPRGVLITRVMSGTPAAEARLVKGERIVSIAGRQVVDVEDLRLELARANEHDVIRLDVEDERGETRPVELVTSPKPLEEHAGCDIIYSEIACDGYRTRAIVTLPEARHGDSTLPFVLFVQGHGADSIDAANQPDRPLSRLAAEYAKRGFVFVRFDRSGIGDSEGPLPSRLSLAEEIHQVERAWAFAGALPFVDKSKGVVLAHSLGSIAAGRLVQTDNKALPYPKALIVYGGGAKTWSEYFCEQCRRQWSLEGASLLDQDRAIRRLSRFHALLLVERLPLPVVLEQMPEVLNQPDLYAVESSSIVRGRPYEYWQEVHESSIVEDLQTARLNVLAAWGSSDWLSSREDHELIARAVNEASPGFGTFEVVEQADHGFASRPTPLLSYRSKDAGRLSEDLAVSFIDWSESVVNGLDP